MAQLYDTQTMLRRTRPDYVEEATWHKFLIDASYGTGGFRGRIAPPEVSVLGWAAKLYEGYTAARSYLDQFKREDTDKFNARVLVSHYRNYVGPFVQLIVGFVNKHVMSRSEEGEPLAAWRDNCDGNGTTWDTMLTETIRPTAARIGYCPVLFDMPATMAADGEAELSLAQRQDLRSEVMPRAIPLYPVNLPDWECDDTGALVWAKVRTDHEVRPDALLEGTCEERYAIWYRDRVEKHVIQRGQSIGETFAIPVTIKHSWGQVPIIIFRGEPTPGERVRGRSIVADAAVEARTHFNLSSEKRDHERASTFAILGVPVQSIKDDIGTLIGGNGSAIKIPATSTQPLHYVAPPESVAASLETSLASSVKEMYRISRIEYEAPTGTATSGIARAYQFEQTNSRLRDLANGWARSEQEALRLVATGLGDKSSEKMTVTPPSDFNIDDLLTEIQEVAALLDLPIGETASGEILKRAVRKAAPNMTQEQDALVSSEIDDAIGQQQADDALERETAQAMSDVQLENAKAGGNGEVVPA